MKKTPALRPGFNGTTTERRQHRRGERRQADFTMFHVNPLVCKMPNMHTPTNTDTILAARGSRYGTFTGHAEVTQALKRCMAEHLAKRDKQLTDDQWEALEMIAHKIGRIINGDPDYYDSWADIAGYAKLVSDRLETGVEV